MPDDATKTSQQVAGDSKWTSTPPAQGQAQGQAAAENTGAKPPEIGNGTVLTPPSDKAAASTGAEAEKDAAKNAAAAKAPEKPKEYKLVLPQGQEVAPEDLERLTNFAREKGLSEEQAQALLEYELSGRKAFVEAQKRALAEQVTSWAKELETDKEVGGEKFNENIELARRFIAENAPPEFMKALNETGFGNYPPLVRFIVRLARKAAPDNMGAPQTQGAAQDLPLQERLRKRYQEEAKAFSVPT